MRLPSPAVIVALLTPFSEDGRLAREALAAHVDVLVEMGIDAVMPCGTTGEGPLLEPGEVVEVVEATVQAAAGRVPVLAHVGRPSTEATIRLGARALEVGAEAVSAVVPYYYPLDQAGLVAHFRALVKALPGTPVFAYNIPARTVNDLEPASLTELAGDGLAGLKDSTGDLERHAAYLEAARAGAMGRPLAVFAGSEAMFVESVRSGSSGSVSAMANLRGDLVAAMKRAWVEGREDEATAIAEELATIRGRVLGGGGIPALKRATADALLERGIAYPPFLRAPLG